MKIITIDEAKKIVPDVLDEPMHRKALTDKCIQKYFKDQKLSLQQLEDRSPGHLRNKIGCKFGEAITALINEKTLTQDKENIVWYGKKISAESAKQVIQRDELINKVIMRLLQNRKLSRKDLLSAVVGELNADAEFVKAAKLGKKNFATVIKADGGRLLDAAVKNADVVLDGNVYSLPAQETPQERNERLFKAINDHGVLLNQTLFMLKKWYESKGYTVEQSKNTDGKKDGGIDGVIKCVDGMDYPHKIILQVKCFENANRSAKEVDVRAFCGITAADDATMGLFVTNGKYDADTKALVKKYKVKYFKLIDGKMWLKLADDCGYDISENLT